MYASGAVLEAEPPRANFQPTISLRVPTFAYGALALLIFMVIVLWAIPDGNSRSGIGSLLDNATAALSDGRLVGPGEDNALGYYQSVLERDPANPAALEGLDMIAEEYLTRTRWALASEVFDSAVGNLATARDVQPEHFGIAAIADLVGRYRQELLVRAQRVSATDLPQAERYLAQAAAMPLQRCSRDAQAYRERPLPGYEAPAIGRYWHSPRKKT